MKPRHLGLTCFAVAVLCSGCSTTSQSSGPALPAVADALEHPINLADTDVQPVVLERAAPQYPRALRRAGVRGEAVIDFVVDTNGAVVRPAVLKATHPLFGEAAKAAIQQWRFRAAQKDGKRVACHMQVPIVFALDDRT